MPQFGGASEKCSVCSKTVYLAEKIVVEDKDEKKTFHKNCLKCTHCKATLSLGNYASMNGVMYCKPHFKQLFATKGNYDEGFGKDKLTSKWSPAPAHASQTAGSFVPVEKTDDVKSTSEKNVTPSSIASKFGKTSISAEKCETCSKTVYATEKIVIEEKDGKKVFHKACLKCTHCSVVLTLGNYASMNGVTYCKPHFKQLFATKGNYDEGFGKDKHTTKWDPNSNANPATFVPVEKTDTPRETAKSSPSSNEVANRFKGMGASDKCSVCGKTVYLTEKIVVEDKEDKKLFHKACLRCTHCQVVLSLGNYAAMGGVYYCKPHFKQLFATKGNYDEGFGKEKHTAKWIDPEDKEAAQERFGGGSPRKEEGTHDAEHKGSLQETPREETTDHHARERELEVEHEQRRREEREREEHEREEREREDREREQRGREDREHEEREREKLEAREREEREDREREEREREDREREEREHAHAHEHHDHEHEHEHHDEHHHHEGHEHHDHDHDHEHHHEEHEHHEHEHEHEHVHEEHRAEGDE